MRHTPITFLVMMLVLSAGSAAAQSTGVQRTERDSLSAFGDTPLATVFLFAERFQDPFFSSSFATVTVIDLTTFDVKQCGAANFDLAIKHTRSVISFVTEDGFNCPIGVEVSMTCDVAANTVVTKSVANGTITNGAFALRFSTHSNVRSFNSLHCQVSALGVETDSLGNATTERGVVTP